MDHSEIERLQGTIDRFNRVSGMNGFLLGAASVLSIGFAVHCSITDSFPISLVPIATALGLSWLYGYHALDSRASRREMEWRMAEIRSIQRELDRVNRLRGM